MPVAELKRSFGERLVLWGGVPAELLIDASDEEIADRSRETLDGCAAGGGYVFGTSHSIMPGSDLRRYRIMLGTLANWNETWMGGRRPPGGVPPRADLLPP